MAPLPPNQTCSELFELEARPNTFWQYIADARCMQLPPIIELSIHLPLVDLVLVLTVTHMTLTGRPSFVLVPLTKPKYKWGSNWAFLHHRDGGRGCMRHCQTLLFLIMKHAHHFQAGHVISFAWQRRSEKCPLEIKPNVFGLVWWQRVFSLAAHCWAASVSQ